MTQPPYPYYPPQPTAPPKSPGVAAILSLIIPGLGSLYTGNPLWGMFWFITTAIAAATLALGIGVIVLPVVWILAVMGAWMNASSFNRRHHVVR